MREVNLLNRGNANLFVPKSEVLSAEATLSNLISLDSTFSLINISVRLRCVIPRVKCGISDAYTQAWLSSSMIVASWGNPIRFNMPLIVRASSFKNWFTALIYDSAVDVDKLPWVLLVKLTTLWWPMYPMCALVECKLSRFPARSASHWNRAWVSPRIVSASYGPGCAWNLRRSSLLYSQFFTKHNRKSTWRLPGLLQ